MVHQTHKLKLLGVSAGSTVICFNSLIKFGTYRLRADNVYTKQSFSPYCSVDPVHSPYIRTHQ